MLSNIWHDCCFLPLAALILIFGVGAVWNIAHHTITTPYQSIIPGLSKFDKVCQCLPRSDDVWRGLTRFDEVLSSFDDVWQGLTNFVELLGTLTSLSNRQPFENNCIVNSFTEFRQNWSNIWFIIIYIIYYIFQLCSLFYWYYIQNFLFGECVFICVGCSAKFVICESRTERFVKNWHVLTRKRRLSTPPRVKATSFSSPWYSPTTKFFIARIFFLKVIARGEFRFPSQFVWNVNYSGRLAGVLLFISIIRNKQYFTNSNSKQRQYLFSFLHADALAFLLSLTTCALRKWLRRVLFGFLFTDHHCAVSFWRKNLRKVVSCSQIFVWWCAWWWEIVSSFHSNNIGYSPSTDLVSNNSR